MASQMLISNLASIPAVAAATSSSGHRQGQCVSSKTSSSSFPTEPRWFLGSSQPFKSQKQQQQQNTLGSRNLQGGCWAMPKQLGLLSSAGIVDQNERLKDAAKAGDLQALKEILRLAEVTVDLPSSNRAGWTALHLACFYGHSSIVQSLLEAGANVEVRNDSGNTPLQLASLKGSVDIARILLDSGADLYAESLDRGTALDYAQEWGGEDILDFLLLWAAKKNYDL